MNMYKWIMDELTKSGVVNKGDGKYYMNIRSNYDSLNIIDTLLAYAVDDFIKYGAVVSGGFFRLNFIEMNRRDFRRMCEENPIEFNCKTDIKEYSSEAKRPYFRIRGKKLTEEQAIDAISKLGGFICNWRDDLSDDDVKNLSNKDEYNRFIIRRYFEKQGYKRTSGNFWIGHVDKENGGYYDNGFIYTNGSVGRSDVIYDKYPYFDEIFCDMPDIARSLSYIDMVYAITKWHELCPSRWDAEFGCAEAWDNEELRLPYETEREFYDRWDAEHPERDMDEWEFPYDELTADDIDIAFHITYNKIEIVPPEEAIRLMDEYESQYTDDEIRNFAHGASEHVQRKLVDLNFFHKMLEKYPDIPEDIRNWLLNSQKKAIDGESE